ncbi:MAG: transcription antitermination factor NusB [Selenomonadaceae bacterium]|nr:transcription antitermination factor NusB [Selenomonadaceae bacterium]
MSRRLAREAVLQALFQLDLNHGDEGEQEKYEALAVDTALQEGEKLSAKERGYVTETVHGTRSRLTEIDALIASYAKGWKLGRMAAVDRNILRLASYEMKFCDPVLDPGIVINEAVELAKKYGTDDSGRFVNGILDAMAR